MPNANYAIIIIFLLNLITLTSNYWGKFMLIIDHKIYSRSHKLVMIILECIMIGFSIALVLLGAIGQFFVQEEIFYSISSFVWALGILSCADLLRIIKNKRSIILSFIVRVKRKKNTYSKSPTEQQQKVLDKLFSSAANQLTFTSIIVKGEKGTGKSECVDFVLKKIFSKIKDDNSLINFNFHYIDCYDDSDKTTEFITALTAESVKNYIIFIDNCNEARGEIIPNIEYLTKAKNCCIILMEEEGTFYYDNKIFNTDNKESFTYKPPLGESLLQKYRYIIKSKNQKRIIFAIYLLSKYKNLFASSDIEKLLDLTKINKLKYKLFISKLKNKNILQTFPVFSTFYKLASESEVKFIASELIESDEELFREIINEFVNICDNDEIKWMCLFEFQPKFIEDNTTELYQLFNKAIAYGNYSKLLKILGNYCQKNNCYSKFPYELAVLHYYNGAFDTAYSYLKKMEDVDDIHKCVLLIETLHGKNDMKIKKLVVDTIEIIKNKEQLLGEYWEYHIGSEEGRFETDGLKELLTKLIANYNNESSELIKSVIERCFTDLLRFYWITGIDFDIDPIKNDFSNIFEGSRRYEYYIKLYFDAGNMHYSTVVGLWLDDDLNQIENKVHEAINSYNSAIALPYEKLKSKTAAKTKLADISLMQPECEWHEIEKYVLEFKENAERQKIDVFIAYSQTLLAKIKILRYLGNLMLTPANKIIDEITNLLNSALAIYQAYSNSYGVTRCNYLLYIFQCLRNFDHDNSEFDKYWHKLIDLSENCTTLETKFIAKLNSYKSFQYINFYNSIKYFPIILQ